MASTGHAQTADYGSRLEHAVYSGKFNTNPYTVPSMTEVTRILSAIDQGDPHAAAELLPLVYDQLRRLAAEQMAREKPGQTLDATALVHEAWIRLAGGRQYEDRRHFFRAAAEAMRRILVDQARAKGAGKRGGGRKRVEFADWHQITQMPDQVLALHEALNRFAAVEPRKAELVTLRFFGGLTMPQAAQALSVSLPTAERWWAFARSWLYTELEDAAE
jgi:RNA polymerase sigma factor (TIGR02999 family)